MELFRSQTISGSQRQSVKFQVPCQEQVTDGRPTTDPWLSITKLLEYTNGNVAILLGKGGSKTVVVKFGDAREIAVEYKVAEDLYAARLPGFIKFLCMFQCRDNFKDLLAQNYVARPHICEGAGSDIGCIVMPFYPLGSMNNYAWKKHQIDQFKNVLKQVCFSLCVAYEKTGFVHMDLHAGNVLLRETKKPTIDYGHVVLPIVGRKYAIVMDVYLHCVGKPELFLGSLERILYTSCTSNASDLAFDFTNQKIREWSKKYGTSFSAEAFEHLGNVIDAIPLRFVKSEVQLQRMHY